MALGSITVFYGPDSAFSELVDAKTTSSEYRLGYLEAIRALDQHGAVVNDNKSRESNVRFKLPVCIARSSDFGSVTNHVIPSFATLLGAFDIDKLFVQNPPRRAVESLQSQCREDSIEVVRHSYRQFDKRALPTVHTLLERSVLGQEKAKRSLIASLYRQAVVSDEKPTVLLLYGPSGVGKTQSAHCLIEAVGDKLMRVQFSMMQTSEAYDYLFGAENSKVSFARELLGRESNVVLIDEFDKVSPTLYNMFYQLFDEGRFVDTNYDVDMRNALFLLTSNFRSEADIQKSLGSAMFSRITSCIGFNDLTPWEKTEIATRHYKKVLGYLDAEDKAVIEQSNILPWFQAHARDYNNMRTMKNKVEKAIFDKLSAPIFEDPSSTEPKE
jgi:ATP-dependent Clp protease ATP-binding subunit ClpA